MDDSWLSLSCHRVLECAVREKREDMDLRDDLDAGRNGEGTLGKWLRGIEPDPVCEGERGGCVGLGGSGS